jgi:uncharacterized protein Yka (UPF0111/DUF47 family)
MPQQVTMWYARDMSIENTPLSQITDELNELEMLYSRKERFKQLSPAEMREILGRLHQIQETLPDSPQQLHKVLLTAVTRLSADISNHMMDKLVDTVQQKQHSIDFLQQELSRKLREQHTASQLLNQTQRLRVKTQQLSDEFQLGSIL